MVVGTVSSDAVSGSGYLGLLPKDIVARAHPQGGDRGSGVEWGSYALQGPDQQMRVLVAGKGIAGHQKTKERVAQVMVHGAPTAEASHHGDAGSP